MDYLPIPTWHDLADIIFLSIVAYHLYMWFKGTRALRVLIGLVILGGVYSLAKLWGLFLTTWVFQILWQVLVILLLILFQSEIRQVLEKVNFLRFLRSRRTSSTFNLAGLISEVSFDLAGKGTGALLVVTREDDPEEFIQAGHKIMAMPEPALIRNIFNHHTATHDGAIVISEGKITKMGCILPLSKREDLPEHLGTRHRAALGLSEKTDSICIVVSEERSEVSTAVNGKITTWQDAPSLSRRLRELLRGPEIPRASGLKILRDTFVKRPLTKLGSLGIVILAWLIMAGPQEIKKEISIPIDFRNVPSGLMIEKTSAKSVEVVLSGSRRNIRTSDLDTLTLPVDLSMLTEGSHLVSPKPKYLNLPRGILAYQVKTKGISIDLVKKGPP